MKITILSKLTAVFLVALLFACGSEEKKSEPAVVEKQEEKETTTPEAYSTPTNKPSEENTPPEEVVNSSTSKTISGEEKVANSDCLSCHLVERMVVGPAYMDIAAEYENNDENVAMLANKVIKGGAGVWGETAMPPHPNLSEEDAKDMVRYILGLY
ncbi:c-type cytochrome [Algoriphagus sp.]|uniref:c-type cytochrome n=1 Tax=Algoriphagus sp. TaxID=1872435 RepID=UPI0025E9123A|nr:c-type cytochrome [Algoriphagus sp.]